MHLLYSRVNNFIALTDDITTQAGKTYMENLMTTKKIVLRDDEMPKRWYNVCPDIPEEVSDAIAASMAKLSEN